MNFTTNFGKRARFSTNPNINQIVRNKTLVNEPSHTRELTTNADTNGILRDKQSMLSRSMNLGMLYNIDKPNCSSCRGAK